MSNKKYLSIWIPITAFLTILVVGGNMALSVWGGWVNTVLGDGTYEITPAEGTEDWDTDYNKSSYDSYDDLKADADVVIQKLVSEGAVLAKNEGASLPLTSGAKITMLGRTSADPVYGGAGSSSMDNSANVNAYEGLASAGFDINDTAYAMFEKFATDHADPNGEFGRGYITMDDPSTATYGIGEMPVEMYSDEVTASFSEYSDAAVVVIGRPAGEGGDLTQDMINVVNTAGVDSRALEGEHQLQLNQDERDMIELAKANFDNVVVLVNASTSMELGDLHDDADIDSIVLMGGPGATGYHAIGQLLVGATNFSGHTTDLWARDFSADPTFVNFGHFQYDNVNSPTGVGTFVQYEEGIYFGYRYYETAAVEGFIDYDEAVVYPFGYGLSYTDFSWEIAGHDFGGVDGEISVDVTVTNTGDVAGKDVVQLYYSAPYTPGGIEKAHVVLGDFAKTGELAPGASETVTVTFAVEDMASYDYKNEKAYVLDSGEYQILVQQDSHHLAEGVEALTYEVDDTIVFSGDNTRATDEQPVTNLFDDVNVMFTDVAEEGKALNMTRADFAGTFPTAPEGADFVATDEIVADFERFDSAAAAAAFEGEMPVTGADGGLQLVNLRGLDYNDPLWDELLDQLTVEEMTSVILNGAYNTAAIESIAKPATVDLDGPLGFSSWLNDFYNGVPYPTPYLIAQTWNVDLLVEQGEMLGEESLFLGNNGWYAPGVNIHRSPFAGRNFEYYSEDPYLSGVLAREVSNGTMSKGLYTFIKHYAVNDQETNRVANGVATWANEQAMREIYLKAFEIPVKEVVGEVPFIADEDGTWATAEVGQTAIMSSFNRVGSVWAGGSIPLMDTVLRGEWGFEGEVITDFNANEYMYPDMAVEAGSDIMLTFEPWKQLDDVSSAWAVTNLRESIHNILYATVNSNAMNGIAPNSTVTIIAPEWHLYRWIITAALSLGIVGLVGMIVVRVRRHGSSVPVAEVTESDAPKAPAGV
ncbi:glycoside hydrolase family 3 C-terminal domain-containing protein [Demequina pelophila]|uniref:glycoside hydrolase family 3 C-terminal domain-containing protein n=1 Tax=Demequina pelophila TaxID=1638984 RepID=UPI0009E36BBE|nr:glycoside hydrolase family 3 C-terminal domain-containing protein [Demequina pelophila]